MDFETLKPAIVLRRMPKNGNNKSEEVNDFIEQAIHDIAGLYGFVNSVVVPAFNGFGKTGTWSDIDPILNGIDGTTIMVSRGFTDTTSPYFYDSGKSRPKTVFESLLQVVGDLDRAFIGINEVKARLGTNDDNSVTPTSQATLSEVETKVNYLNSLVQQIRNANAGYLNAGMIASGLADGTINPTTFNLVNGDVLADAGILATKISGVDLTANFDYSGGVPTTYDMADTVQRVKEWIEDFTGETFEYFISGNVHLGAGANATARGHIMASGTGTVSDTNPHGLDVIDLQDATGALARPQMVADFDVRISGVSPNYEGGYSYIPTAFTLTSVSLTLGQPGTTGLGVVLYARSAGSDTVVKSGLLLSSSPTPGSVSADISYAVAAGDLLFLSGVAGTGHNARVQVFGR